MKEVEELAIIGGEIGESAGWEDCEQKHGKNVRCEEDPAPRLDRTCYTESFEVGN